MKTMAAAAHHRNHCYSQAKPRMAGRFGTHRSRGFAGVSCRNFATSSPRLRSERAKSSPEPSKKRASFDAELSRSELFAGPICLNSPPPSSLPIPKFSIPRKRGVPLELALPPLSGSELEQRSVSAPSSPTGDDVATATENLRRILQLDGC